MREANDLALSPATAAANVATVAKTETARQARLANWFRTWKVPMRRWLQSRSSVPYDHLDDVVQEVFIRLLRYSDDELVENPQSYLFRVATNVANEWRERSANRMPHAQDGLEDIEDERPVNDGEIFNEQQQAAIVKAIAILPPRHKAVVIYHMHGLTYHQIEKRMGISYRMVLRDLTNAYASLRKQLDAWR